VPLVDALAEASGAPHAKVRALLTGLLRDARVRDERPRGKLVIPKGVGPMLPAHRNYLKGRGLDPDAVARLWGVQGIGMAPRLAWRLWIPIHRHGKTVSWTTRALYDSKLRYLNAKPDEEALPAKSLLYGADLARHAVAVQEGPLDAWAVGPGAVATLGVGHTKEQVLEMAKFPVRVIVFDAEPEAQRRARRLAADLSCFPGVTHNVTWESGKDASRCDPAEVAEFRRRFLE
jgi:hypothetical protein